VKRTLLTWRKVSAALATGFLVSVSSLAEDSSNALSVFNANPYRTDTGLYPYLTDIQDLQIRPSSSNNDKPGAFQRNMNHQWLSEQTGQSGLVEGDYAVSRLIERQLKSYLDSTQTSKWLKEVLMLGGNGSGFLKSVDYGLEVHSDRLVIGIAYEF